MIYIKKGDSETITTTPIETCDHEPVDLSAATVKMIIKRNMTDPDDSALYSAEIVNSDTNILAFQISAETTAAMDVGDYIMGIRIEWDSGEVRELVSEEIRITQGVFNG